MPSKDTSPDPDWRASRRIVTADGEIVVLTHTVGVRSCAWCGAAMLYAARGDAGQRYCSRSCAGAGRPRNTYAAMLKRLHGRVERGAPDVCWPFLGARDSDGYGTLSWRGKTHRATRLVWESLRGPIAAGLVVRHRCDVPSCCNPAHLLLGTNAENRADAVARGRTARGGRAPRRLYPERYPVGERVNKAKLTAPIVRAMREAFQAGGTTFSELGRVHGVTSVAARRAVLGLTWKHLE